VKKSEDTSSHVDIVYECDGLWLPFDGRKTDRAERSSWSKVETWEPSDTEMRSKSSRMP